ncbi:MAG: hypothetical protein K0R65_1705 [Crocinitomicaceae bacterium]|jgi:hypothetical protein|nr:hypothetical protein [Crocinitomicaceae bacterium]
MMKLKHISYLLLAGILFTACKKKIVEIPESNSPVFVTTGQLGEDNISIVAGDDDAQFSNSISTINGVSYYSGTLIQGSTEIELGMYKGDNELPQLNIDNITSLSSMGFASLPLGPLFEVKRENFENNSNIKEIKWYVDDVYAGTNSVKIFEPGKYRVCAKILYANKYESEVCNDIIVGYTRSNELELDFSLEGNNQFTSWIESTGTVSHVKWYLNEQLISEETSLSTVLPATFNKLKAEVTFADGSKRVRSVMVDGTHSDCSIEDFARQEQNDNLSWDYKLRLNIKYEGNEYSSMDVDNSESSLKISSIDYFGIDSKGNPVYLVKGLLKSKVKSKATNDILDVNLNISWGLGLK